MKTATLTAEQKDKLTAAIKKSLDESSSVKAALYPRPKVEPADAFGVLDPNKNNAVDNTYIVVGGIPLNYLVSFYWNGDYSIKAVTSEGTDIQVKVPSALVIAAGDTATQPILVIYSVLNPNEPEGVASEPLKLTVLKYVRPAYPKPVITEAQGNELDVTALIANAHMTLKAWPGQAVGQKLWLSVVSTPQITLQNWNPLNVTELGAQSRFISMLLLQKLTDGSAFTLKLEASFDGGDTRFAFSEQTYQIKKAPAVFPAPTIVEANGGSLNPMSAEAGATFRAKYDTMASSDVIVPIWDGISNAIPSRNGEADHTVDFSVPATLISPVIGKTIDLQYEVQRGGQTFMSDVLKLKVEAIPQTDLPTPQIPKASGDILDVGALVADADLTVAAWPFIAPGQMMWMVLRGSSTETLASWNGYVINSAGAQATKIPLEGYLQKLTDGSALELALEVSFDGGATRQVFPLKRYTVTAKPAIIAPTISTVLDTNGAEIPNGGETTDTTVRFIGTATKNSPVLLYINYGGAMTATADAEGNWSITWRGLEVDSTHSFFATTIDEALRSNTWLIKVIALITVWDFNDHTFQGWTAQGPYTSLYGLESGVLMTDTPRGPNWQGNVISRTINVIAGKHYEFEFAAASITTAGRYSAALRFTINNSAIGQTVQVGSGWHKGTGSYTASRTEAVTLSIWNDTSSPDGNDFQIDYVSMKRSG